MREEKYIGMDVHLATISVTGSDISCAAAEPIFAPVLTGDTMSRLGKPKTEITI